MMGLFLTLRFFFFLFSWRCHLWLWCCPDVCRPSASQQAQQLWDHGCHGNAVFLSLSSSLVFSFPVSSLSWSLSHNGSMIWMFYLRLTSKPSLLLCPFLNLFKSQNNLSIIMAIKRSQTSRTLQTPKYFLQRIL